MFLSLYVLILAQIHIDKITRMSIYILKQKQVHWVWYHMVLVQYAFWYISHSLHMESASKSVNVKLSEEFPFHLCLNSTRVLCSVTTPISCHEHLRREYLVFLFAWTADVLDSRCTVFCRTILAIKIPWSMRKQVRLSHFLQPFIMVSFLSNGARWKGGVQ